MAPTNTPKKLRVLIAGAGIAGPVVAYWLARANAATITVVERDPKLRTTGQSIDLRGVGIEIVKQMGLIETVRAGTTNEAGMAHVDSKGRQKASFGVAEPGSKTQSFTSEFELFRGTLAEIFYQATKDDAEYVFGDEITSVSQTPNHATVTFKKRATEDFDLVVGADGIGSKLRAMTFNVSRREHLHPLGGWAAYFTVPKDHLNGEKFALWYNSPGGRVMLLRPDPEGKTRANLMVMFHNDLAAKDEFRKAQETGRQALRNLCRDKFNDAGWITPEILNAMDDAEDFYVQEMAQVKLPTFYKGRVAFVGDAGACPSPLSGMGTTVAITQAYVLAGEIVRNSTDISKALQSYDEITRPMVKEAQSLFPGMTKILAPKSKTGIKLVLGVLEFVTRTHLDKAMMVVAAPGAKKKENAVPEYKWPVAQEPVANSVKVA